MYANMQGKKGLTAKDLVTIGIFSALFLVFALVGGIFFAPNPVLTFYMPVGSALLCGPVYLLMMAKVKKRGAAAILGAILCVVWFVTGMHWAMAVGYLVMGIAADFVAGAGKYQSKKNQFAVLYPAVAGRHGLVSGVLCQSGRLGQDHAGQRYGASLYRYHALGGNHLDFDHHAGGHRAGRRRQRVYWKQNAEKAV